MRGLSDKDHDDEVRTSRQSERSVPLNDGARRSVFRGGARSVPKVAVDVVGVAALGFQLNGHVFDAEA